MDPTNPLIPMAAGEAGGGGEAPAPAPASPSLFDQLGQRHSVLRARVDSMEELQKKQSLAKTEIDQLMGLGDMVTQSEVVDAAGRLVAGGLDPVSVATLLSDMPPDGQALAQWVATRDAGLAKAKAQLAIPLDVAKHSLGVSALHMLGVQGAQQAPGPIPPSGPSAQANPLMGAPNG